jgi:hypothetical protein
MQDSSTIFIVFYVIIQKPQKDTNRKRDNRNHDPVLKRNPLKCIETAFQQLHNTTL